MLAHDTPVTIIKTTILPEYGIDYTRSGFATMLIEYIIPTDQQIQQFPNCQHSCYTQRLVTDPLESTMGHILEVRDDDHRLDRYSTVRITRKTLATEFEAIKSPYSTKLPRKYNISHIFGLCICFVDVRVTS